MASFSNLKAEEIFIILEIVVIPPPPSDSPRQKLMDLIDSITEELDLMPDSYNTSTISLTTLLQLINNQTSHTLLSWYTNL